MSTSRIAATLAGALIAMSHSPHADVGPPADSPAKALAYPRAAKGGTVEEYHGTKVADPYRWLEDPDSAETRAWVEAENKVTFAFLEAIPERAKIKERLTKLWDYEKYGVPHREGGRYFFSKNDGLQNQGVLYWAASLEDAPKVLLDPNTLSADGTVALSGTSISDDGKLIAYGLAAAGSDWVDWKVRDVETGKDLDDLIKWVKFSDATWTKDNKGFFYGRFPQPEAGADLKGANYFQKLYYHKVGTPQDADTLVWEDKEHKDLVLTLGKGTDDKYRVLYRKLADSDAAPVHLVGDFDAEYSFLDNDGPVFYFKTNKDAPRGKVVAIDTRSPEPSKWTTLIPEVAETLGSVSLVGDRFIASYLKDAHTQVRIFGLDGKAAGEVDFPGLGTATGFGGKRSDKETFYAYTSYTTPTTIYRYDLDAGKSAVYKAPKLTFNPDEYVTTQAFYASKDGTKVPIFLSHKKGLKKDGQNPTLLYGYGGFNISLTPAFSPSNLAWMELGGLLAIPNLRGGGEYGEDWHQGGTKLNKQNVFEDFIAAAEYLIAEKYTSTPKLAISGGSNGGLLVGACMTQRPELFGAALPAVGVLDMLRFHKFTIGWAWIDDYGSSDDPGQFKALHAYSPLHNLKPGTAYPPTLVTTADHDDRVVPAHSFKFAATLQEVHSGDSPVLIRIETKAGHGAGKPTTKQIEEAADKIAFLVKVLGIPAN
jgi:prolyl oligopeptidase